MLRTLCSYFWGLPSVSRTRIAKSLTKVILKIVAFAPTLSHQASTQLKVDYVYRFI